MEYRKYKENCIVRINKDEEIVENLKQLCEKENIKCAEITGLGASNLVEIGVFNINTKEYSETNPILGNWAGNTKQREEYANKFNLSNNNYNNQYAAAGLYYNFKKIKFDKGINASQNEGCYNAVNGKTTGTLSETEFIAGGAEEVHALTLAEINEARGESDLTNTPLNENSGAKGLFYLTALEDYGYTKTNMSTSPKYFLASPVIGNTNSLNCVDDKGQLTSMFFENYGVRTVISLPPDFEVEKME